jgi:hypothetical protein
MMRCPIAWRVIVGIIAIMVNFVVQNMDGQDINGLRRQHGMSEFNRERIIRNLEHLVDKYGENGSYNTYCTLSDSLTLIKELTEENEKLNERLDREARCQYDLCGQIVNLRDDVKYIKADTVRKFLDKFKDWPSDDQEYIERYAKEILEENK